MKQLFFIAALMLMCTNAVQSQKIMNKQDSSYYVRITDPANDGFRVGRTYKVTGIAKLPPGYSVFLLAHKEDFPGWWPQSVGKLDPVNGEWKATVYIGEAWDIGDDFEIVAIMVDETTLAKLQIKVNTAISLPDSKYSALRVVNKISH